MNGWFIGFTVRVIAGMCWLLLGFYLAWKKPFYKSRSLFFGYYILRLLSMFILLKFSVVPYDVVGWYQHADWILSGGIPGLNFSTPYNIGFEYLLAACVRVYDSPFSIIVLFTVAELVALILLHKSLRFLANPLIANRVIILYLTNPVTWFNSWLAAQDESLLLLVLSVFIYASLFTKSKMVYMFILAVLGYCGTKILAIIYLLPIWMVKGWRAVFILGTVVVCWTLFVISFDINPLCFTFGREYNNFSAGDDLLNWKTVGNIWFLFPKASKLTEYVSLFLAELLFVSMYLKSLFSSSEDKDKFNACFNCLLSAVLIYNLFCSMTYGNYFIPIIPFLLYQTVMAARNKIKFNVFLFTVFGLWSLVMSSKDSLYAGRVNIPLINEVVSSYTIGIVSVLFNIIMLFIVLFLSRKYLTSPAIGIKFSCGKISCIRADML